MISLRMKEHSVYGASFAIPPAPAETPRACHFILIRWALANNARSALGKLSACEAENARWKSLY